MCHYRLHTVCMYSEMLPSCHVKLLFPLVLHSVQLSERLEVYKKRMIKKKKNKMKKKTKCMRILLVHHNLFALETRV